MSLPLSRASRWLAVAMVLVFPSSHAGEPKKSPAPVCFVRVWTGHLGDLPAVRVGLKGSGKKGASIELIKQAPAYRLGDYAEVPALNWIVEVTGAANQPSATLPALFAPGSSTTLLIQRDGETMSARAIDDTLADRETATLTVRNLAPQLTHLRVQAGAGVQAQLVSPASYLQVAGLARTRMEVETSGDERDGQTWHWTNDIDFSKVARATILILPDPYGRLRPRVVIDGRDGDAAAR